MLYSIRAVFSYCWCKPNNFLLLLLQSKSIQLVKYNVPFTVKQSQETQCICLAPTTFFSRYFLDYFVSGSLQQPQWATGYCYRWLAKQSFFTFCNTFMSTLQETAEKSNQSPCLLCQYWTGCLFVGYVDKPT